MRPAMLQQEHERYTKIGPAPPEFLIVLVHAESSYACVRGYCTSSEAPGNACPYANNIAPELTPLAPVAVTVTYVVQGILWRPEQG